MIIVNWSNLFKWFVSFFIATDIALFVRLLSMDLYTDTFYGIEKELCIKCPLYDIKKKGEVCDPDCDLYILPKNLEILSFFMVWLISLIAIDPGYFMNTFLPPFSNQYIYLILIIMLVFTIVGLLVFFIFVLQYSSFKNLYKFTFIVSISGIVLIILLSVIGYESNSFGSVYDLLIIFFIMLIMFQNFIQLKLIKVKYYILTIPFLSLLTFFIIMVIRIIEILEIGGGIKI